MQVGVIFPQTEIGTDAGAIREYAQAVEKMGYSHVLAYDHVIGANTTSRPDWRGPYNLDSMFHEPLMLFSFMASATTTLKFFTGILILPQRQTVMVAKQAASLDILCTGRLRLGVGIGWNPVEYEALGMNFAERAKRYPEQIEVLRALWTKRALTFKGQYHTIEDAGIYPLPVQQPIPIWMGGGADRPHLGFKAKETVIRRIARLADGWLPLWEPDERGYELLEKFHGFCREYGRDPKQVGLEGRLDAHMESESAWVGNVEAWRKLGASHLAINTMGDNLHGAEEHLRRLEAFRAAVPSK